MLEDMSYDETRRIYVPTSMMIDPDEGKGSLEKMWDKLQGTENAPNPLPIITLP